MTWFFYTDGREGQYPSESLKFRANIGLVEPDGPQKGMVRDFIRHRCHAPDRCTVIYVEKGTPNTYLLRRRICKALGRVGLPQSFLAANT